MSGKKVHFVGWDRVWFDSSGSLCQAQLFKQGDVPPPKPMAAAEPPLTEPTSRPKRLTCEVAPASPMRSICCQTAAWRKLSCPRSYSSFAELRRTLPLEVFGIVRGATSTISSAGSPRIPAAASAARSSRSRKW